VYGWGMGSTKQLGQGDDEDDVFEPVVISGKQLQNKFVYFVFIYINIIVISSF